MPHAKTTLKNRKSLKKASHKLMEITNRHNVMDPTKHPFELKDLRSNSKTSRAIKRYNENFGKNGDIYNKALQVKATLPVKETIQVTEVQQMKKVQLIKQVQQIKEVLRIKVERIIKEEIKKVQQFIEEQSNKDRTMKVALMRTSIRRKFKKDNEEQEVMEPPLKKLKLSPTKHKTITRAKEDSIIIPKIIVTSPDDEATFTESQVYPVGRKEEYFDERFLYVTRNGKRLTKRQEMQRKFYYCMMPKKRSLRKY